MVFYKYVSAERIDILQNLLIRFTQPTALNDPFEAIPAFEGLATKGGFAIAFADTIRQEAHMWEHLKKVTQTNLDQNAFADKIEKESDCAEQLYKSAGLRDPFAYARKRTYKLCNIVGILSFSETPDNLLMWAHYAEEHTGFVLVLDGTHDFFKGNNSTQGFAKPERVQYCRNRPRTTIEEATEREIFLIKGFDWKYEKEWRYLKFLNDADKRYEEANTPSIELFRLLPKCIMGVILGCRRSKELENKILVLRRDRPELRHLRIQQA